MISLGKIFRLLFLCLLGTAAAHAHDYYQANTNVWLRPDKMEVEITLSRGASRMLLDKPPNTPVNEDSFEHDYHAALQKFAPEMLAITLDGKPLQPTSWDVELFEETDIQFTFVYPRPPNGRLRITANFVKRMGDGYGNSLGMNEDKKVLGYADQSADSLAWEITLGKDTGITPPSEISHPPTPPTPGTATPAKTTASTNTPDKFAAQDSYFVIPHFNFWAKSIIFAVIILLAAWFIRQKSGS